MQTLTQTVLHKHRDNAARVTKVTTAHGEFTTPAFMPVGTRSGVNCMNATELSDAGAEIILGGNTYHMLCAPGTKAIEAAGGMHRMMDWSKPMLTDSGGFQVFSLSKNQALCHIDESGAHFTHPETKEIIDMTPEMSLQTQKSIGADIIMAFDQCIPDSASEEEVIAMMERTHRWLRQSKAYHLKNSLSVYGYPQALFGIIQGGVYRHLRERSCEFVLSQELDGIAIGGETIGFDMPKTVEVIQWLEGSLPENKPRYSMGVGLSPQDICDVVASGIDMFDCVAPTRNARHGALYSGQFVIENNWLRFKSEFKGLRLQIKRQEFARDERPIMDDCLCYTCQNFSRGALHYLFKQRTPVFANLASIHNVSVMIETCNRLKQLIERGSDDNT